VCVHNLDDRAHEVTLELDRSRLDTLLDDGADLASTGGRHRVALDALGYRWYRARDA
jgi:hypothetical protein